jgi:hypothetical protein
MPEIPTITIRLKIVETGKHFHLPFFTVLFPWVLYFLPEFVYKTD